jgi:hypothetical protein
VVAILQSALLTRSLLLLPLARPPSQPLPQRQPPAPHWPCLPPPLLVSPHLPAKYVYHNSAENAIQIGLHFVVGVGDHAAGAAGAADAAAIGKSMYQNNYYAHSIVVKFESCSPQFTAET